MNHWRNRLCTGLLLLLTMLVHGEATSGVPNTPGGMFLFHFSAALVDFFIIASLPGFVEGRLCDDLEMLCLVSMVANFIGFVAYMTYFSPFFYNAFMWSLAYAQLGRLFFTDHHGLDGMERNIVRRPDLRRT